MSYIMRDDILAPRGRVIIEFFGPNPIQAYKMTDTWLREVFEGKGTNMFEPKFQWDFGEDPRPFNVVVFIQKPLDKFTKFKVNVRIQGAQPSDPNKNGRAMIEISGFVETTFPTHTAIGKLLSPFFYVYSVSYYNEIRRRYIEMLRRRIVELEGRYRSLLKVPAKVSE